MALREGPKVCEEKGFSGKMPIFQIQKSRVAKTFARYRGHLGPPGPKLEKESENEFPGPLGPEAQKVEKRSRKRVKIDCFSTILTLFQLRLRLFGPRGREAPELIFRLFSNFGPEGPNDPCSRAKDHEDGNGEKLTVKKMVDFWCRFFHGLVPIFFTVYADFSRFIRDINGEKKNLVIDDRFFTVSFSRFTPSRPRNPKSRVR